MHHDAEEIHAAVGRARGRRRAIGAVFGIVAGRRIDEPAVSRGVDVDGHHVTGGLGQHPAVQIADGEDHALEKGRDVRAQEGGPARDGRCDDRVELGLGDVGAGRRNGGRRARSEQAGRRLLREARVARLQREVVEGGRAAPRQRPKGAVDHHSVECIADHRLVVERHADRRAGERHHELVVLARVQYERRRRIDRPGAAHEVPDQDLVRCRVGEHVLEVVRRIEVEGETGASAGAQRDGQLVAGIRLDALREAEIHE